MAEVPISNDDYYDFKYHDHDDDNDFESDRIWGKAKRVRGDTEEAAKAVGGHSENRAQKFCVTNACPSEYVKRLV